VLPEEYLEIILRLLLGWRGSMRRNAVGGRIARATALRFGRGRFRVIALIVVVLIHIHLAGSRLVVLRSLDALLLWCL